MGTLDQQFLYSNGTLRNKLGIRDKKRLQKVEYLQVAHRNDQIMENPIIFIKSFDDLIKIHKILFGWLYDWAGKVRDYQISKGNTLFLPSDRISNGIRIVNQDIIQINQKDKPGSLLYARLLDDTNYVHPFREGNGRSTKAMIQKLARNHGQTIKYPRNTAEMIKALNRSDIDKISKLMTIDDFK